jgi:hypothetical protein
MNLRRRVLVPVLAASLAAGVIALPAQADPAQRTVSPVTPFMSNTVVPGAWAGLVRTDTGIAATLHGVRPD